MVLFLSVFYILTIAVWLARARKLARTRRLTPRLGPEAPPGNAPLVSVVLPVKNEESNVREWLRCMRAQNYPRLEILVVNDNSTDGTEAILKELGADYVNAPSTPAGWTGKNFAIHSGVSKAKGEWLLFTDADTRHGPESVSSAIRFAKERGLELVTALPRCLAESVLEKIIQPIAMGYLGLWFPMEKVNDPASPVFFANGQYLLLSRRLYEKIGGHEAVKGEFLEDFAFARRAKEMKEPMACVLGFDVYGTRMYDAWGPLWRGWRRIYLHAFRRSAPDLLLRAIAMALFSVLPFFALGPALAAGILVPALAAVVLIWGISIVAYETMGLREYGWAFLHPFTGAFLVMVLVDAAWVAATGGRTVWR